MFDYDLSCLFDDSDVWLTGGATDSYNKPYLMLKNEHKPEIIHRPPDQAQALAVTDVSSDETATSSETALVKTEPSGRSRSFTLGNWTPPPVSNLTNGRTEEVMSSVSKPPNETATSSETALVKTEPQERGCSYIFSDWTPSPASNQYPTHFNASFRDSRSTSTISDSTLPSESIPTTEEVKASEETANSKATVPVKSEPYSSTNPPTVSKSTNGKTEEVKDVAAANHFQLYRNDINLNHHPTHLNAHTCWSAGLRPKTVNSSKISGSKRKGGFTNNHDSPLPKLSKMALTELSEEPSCGTPDTDSCDTDSLSSFFSLSPDPDDPEFLKFVARRFRRYQHKMGKLFLMTVNKVRKDEQMK